MYCCDRRLHITSFARLTRSALLWASASLSPSRKVTRFEHFLQVKAVPDTSDDSRHAAEPAKKDRSQIRFHGDLNGEKSLSLQRIDCHLLYTAFEKVPKASLECFIRQHPKEVSLLSISRLQVHLYRMDGKGRTHTCSKCLRMM